MSNYLKDYSYLNKLNYLFPNRPTILENSIFSFFKIHPINQSRRYESFKKLFNVHHVKLSDLRNSTFISFFKTASLLYYCL